MQNHYEALRVSPSATHEQIKQSYRTLALKYHPDRRQPTKSGSPHRSCQQEHDGGSVNDFEWEREIDRLLHPPSPEGGVHGFDSTITAERHGAGESGGARSSGDDAFDSDERFRLVQAAWDCLQDPASRRLYDDELARQLAKARSRRLGATALEWSDCHWVEEDDQDADAGDDEAPEDAECETHPSPESDLEPRGGVGRRGRATVLVYTCRCGEDLFPQLDASPRGDGLLDCRGCSTSYDASAVLSVAGPS
jgi:curved DNA-binding protein CbpA